MHPSSTQFKAQNTGLPTLTSLYVNINLCTRYLLIDLVQQSLQTIGAINTAYTVGAIVAGWFMGGPIADYFGR
jgi:hypothetical protein